MGDSKREIIRKAAIEVIAREGFHRATSDKIAAEAGIAVGTIYYYFQNKEDILAYIFQQEFEKRSLVLEELRKSSMHPLLKIRNKLNYHFQQVKDDDKVTKIILREKHLPFSIPGGVRKFGGIPKFIEDVLEEGVKSGQLRMCNPEILSMAIFGIIEGVVGRYILEKDLNPQHSTDILDQAVDEISDLLWKGLAAECN